MLTKEQFLEVSQYLDSLFPNAKCELFYSQDYELVIAVMLSAQTTDKSVNAVTSHLFKKYPTLKSCVDADIKDIENEIQSLGLYKNKSKNIKGIAETLYNDFNSILPRCEVFKIPDLPVDTHIIRISNRLGIATKKDEPIDIERKLKKIIPEESWIKSHHQLIHFGRYFCTARNPKCEQCKIKKYCKN